MIRKDPKNDLTNPPGQIVNRPLETWRPPKYLRDVIKAAYERSSEGEAPLPLDSAEKRLQALVGALLKACDEAKGGRDWPEGDGLLWASSVRSIIKNNA